MLIETMSWLYAAIFIITALVLIVMVVKLVRRHNDQACLSNRLMRWRIYIQFALIVCLILGGIVWSKMG